MMGKCHVITSEALLFGGYGLSMYLQQHQIDMPWFSGFDTIFAVAGVALGSLLPDIDSKSSILGQKLHLPLQHRTWTHSIWAVLLLFGASYWIGSHVSFLAPFTYAVLFGYWTHLWMDSLSAAGVCFWYPFQRYRRFPNGAFVKPGHKWKLYRAGSLQEWILCAMVSGLCIGFFVWEGMHVWF